MNCRHTGKLVWAHNNDIQSASLKGVATNSADGTFECQGNKDDRYASGEKLNLGIKDMGSCEIFPQTVHHNCNGRFLVVCGDGEYIIYTSQALRNKAFGQALDFAWSAVLHISVRNNLTLPKHGRRLELVILLFESQLHELRSSKISKNTSRSKHLSPLLRGYLVGLA